MALRLQRYYRIRMECVCACYIVKIFSRKPVFKEIEKKERLKRFLECINYYGIQLFPCRYTHTHTRHHRRRALLKITARLS